MREKVIWVGGRGKQNQNSRNSEKEESPMNKTKNEIGATTTDTVRVAKNRELVMDNFMPVNLKIGKMDNF